MPEAHKIYLFVEMFNKGLDSSLRLAFLSKYVFYYQDFYQ